MKDRAAFLLPVYQAQKDFDDTMRSLAASSTHCTVFVVDDGSRPPLQVANYGSMLDVVLLRLPLNQGIVGALNAGLRAAMEADFEFIARIDAGDFIHPDRLARQIAHFETHPGCVMVGSDAEVRDESGSYCFTIEPPRDPRVLAEALHERAWVLHPTVMYRTSILRELGLYSDRFAAAEDYEMFLRISRRHEIGVVPEPLLIYVLRKGSISTSRARQQAFSRLRLQLRYFQWASPISYYGLLRTCGTILMPRRMKNSFKMRFLYSRIPASRVGGGAATPMEMRTRS